MRGTLSAVSTEPFGRVSAFAAALRESGWGVEADALTEAIEVGSTGSEIQMALRYHLRRVAENERIDDALRHRAAELSEVISHTLGTC